MAGFCLLRAFALWRRRLGSGSIGLCTSELAGLLSVQPAFAFAGGVAQVFSLAHLAVDHSSMGSFPLGSRGLVGPRAWEKDLLAILPTDNRPI